MQTNLIPNSVCDKIDKISRDFIWGSGKKEKGTHLIAWEDLCKPKDIGSVGLRKFIHINQALLMKVGWGLINKKYSLWACTIRHKYGCGDDVIPSVKRKNQNSNLWLGICKTWKNVLEGSCWRIGNGQKAKFWKDCCCRKGWCLRDVAIKPLEEIEINRMVSDFFLPNGDWNREELKYSLSEEILEWIVKVHLGKSNNEEDTVQWNYLKEVEFTVKAAYNMLSEEECVGTERHWNYIWKWPGNQRTKTFMWLCAHNKLLTNKQRE